MAKKIRIVAVPPGEAPEWVRQKWIGQELPIAEDIPASLTQTGVKFGPADNIGGYPVETRIAIEILEETSPEAAEWWKQNILAGIMSYLVFKREVCEIV